MKQRSWIIFSGAVWILIGFMLMYKGLQFLSLAQTEHKTLYMAIGLMIGFLKGRFVLVKTVRRVVMRIASLPSPIRYKDVYAPSYYFLILGMMGLGMLLKFLPIGMEIRGMIDVAVGSALMNGAMFYFRVARVYDKSFPSQSQ